MKRTILIALSSLTLLSGCAVYPVATSEGTVYQAAVIPPSIVVTPTYGFGYYEGYWPGLYGNRNYGYRNYGYRHHHHGHGYRHGYRR